MVKSRLTSKIWDRKAARRAFFQCVIWKTDTNGFMRFVRDDFDGAMNNLGLNWVGGFERILFLINLNKCFGLQWGPNFQSLDNRINIYKEITLNSGSNCETVQTRNVEPHDVGLAYRPEECPVRQFCRQRCRTRPDICAQVNIRPTITIVLTWVEYLPIQKWTSYINSFSRR